MAGHTTIETTLGDYTLVRSLGGGTFGQVKALQPLRLHCSLQVLSMTSEGGYSRLLALHVVPEVYAVEFSMKACRSSEVYLPTGL